MLQNTLLGKAGWATVDGVQKGALVLKEQEGRVEVAVIGLSMDPASLARGLPPSAPKAWIDAGDFTPLP